MNYGKVLPIAEAFKSAIAPFCERVEIAGSVRRKKAEVGDIEIVCIPKIETYEVSDGLFGKIETGHHRKFVEIVDSLNIMIGDAKNGKYMRRYSGKAQIQFDIFCPLKENWGNIFAIRTGSEKFSHKVLAKGWEKAGYHSFEGFLYLEENMEYNEKSEKWIPVEGRKPDVLLYEEIDVFNLIGIDYVEPERRNL